MGRQGATAHGMDMTAFLDSPVAMARPPEVRVRLRILRPLDRYILGEFLRIFVVTALGFPLLVIVIDATDNLGKYISRNLSVSSMVLSYVYYIPESLFMVLPASVLFATVFTIGSLTRHSELTAAKASGISFYRLVAPIAIGALLATGVGPRRRASWCRSAQLAGT